MLAKHVAGAMSLAAGLMLAGGALRAQDLADSLPMVDTAAIDQSVSPCENFYRFACGAWIQKNPVPPDRARWSRFDALAELNLGRLRAILDDAAAHPGEDTRKIGDYYASCLDEAAIEAKGTAPLRPELDRIAALQNVSDLPILLAHLHDLGVPSFFSFGAGQDLHDATRVIAKLDQGGLGLGDRDYYLKTDPRSVTLLEAYRKHVASMLRLAGDPAPEKSADQVVAIETDLAKASLERVKRRDPKNLDHPLRREQLGTLTAHFAWEPFITGVGAQAAGDLNVGWPEFFAGFDAIVAANDVPALKSYLRWHLVSHMASVLPKAFVDENFAFFGTTLTGAKEIRARWKRCVDATSRALGEDLGRAYVAQYFPPATKAQTVSMIEQIGAAYEEQLKTLDWMSEETRKQALIKLKTMVNKVGYPDKWRDYSALAVEPGDAFGNALRSSVFGVRYRLGKLGKPVERGEWYMTPPTVNAYYSSQYNDINFPAGILQPPFYDAASDAAANFGAIGAVMGHEMSHGFDDEGRHFDESGNLKDWWTPADATAFEGRAACLATQYGGYTAVDDVKLNGRLTLGENIADNGGLRLAYRALRRAIAGTTPPSRDGYTPEQRFFIGYAQTWCGNATPEDLRRRVQIDPHSPGEFRVNGVIVNQPEFGAAFKCPVPSAMVPPAEKVCRVW